MSELTHGKNPKLLVGVTVGMSAYTLLRGQLSWFKERGWDVSLVTTPDRAAQDASTRENILLNGIAMQRNISPKEDVRALLHWIKLLKLERPDAVNVGTPKAALLGLVGAWLTRVPKRLYVVRGLRLEGATGVMKLILWAMERLSMALATDVLFVSRSLAREAEARRLLLRRKSWLNGWGSSNGVDVAAIQQRIEDVDLHDLRRELNVLPDDFVIGFIGRISADKGVELLIDAMENPRLNEHIKCIIIGGVEDSHLAEQLEGQGDRVRIIPWTNDSWYYLKAIDVLCLLSKREGFPNVVLEAAAAGIPSIVTKATGNVDAVIHKQTGLQIDFEDIDGLVDALNLMSKSPEYIKMLGANAEKRARENFDPENIWTGVEEILLENKNPIFARRLL